MPYCELQDLKDALGSALVIAIFDDDNDGEPEATAVAACLAYGTSECNSFLRGAYATSLPISTVPDELKFAAVDFCCAYAARRRPELAHTLGSDPFKAFYDAATAKMKRYVSGQTRLPAETGTPAGLGGLMLPSPSRSGNSLNDEPARVFDDMGDFNK